MFFCYALATGFFALISTANCALSLGTPLDFFSQLWEVGKGHGFSLEEHTEDTPLELWRGNDHVASVYNGREGVMVKPATEGYAGVRLVLTSHQGKHRDVFPSPGSNVPAEYKSKAEGAVAMAIHPPSKSKDLMVHAVWSRDGKQGIEILDLDASPSREFMEKSWEFGSGNKFSPTEHTEQNPLELFKGAEKVATVYNMGPQGVMVQHEVAKYTYTRFVLVSGKGNKQKVYQVPGDISPAQYERQLRTPVAMAVPPPRESGELQVYAVWPKGIETMWKVVNFTPTPN